MDFYTHSHGHSRVPESSCAMSGSGLFKYLIAMKLTIILIAASILKISAAAYSQAITIRYEKASLADVLQSISEQSGYDFLYDADYLEDAKPVTVDIRKAPLKQVLDIVFKEQPFTYEINEQVIILRPRPVPKQKNDIKQQRTIKGTVTDTTGSPLPGVAVQVKDTNYGTLTDAGGQYTLEYVPEDAIIVFSLIGFQTKELPPNNHSLIDVELTVSVSQLDETIVIGYGTTSRRNNTGSVENISSEDIAKQPVTNVLQALKGRMPGVYIQSSSGLPGAAISVQVRGKNSITAGTDPLYIIDGVPFNTATLDQFNSVNNGGISILNSINPADIERIEVLKDADATAIYGSRAANGVVLITTKKGTAGETRIGVDFYSGFEQVGRRISMMNTSEYLSLRRMAFANDGITPTAANAPDLMTWDTSNNKLGG